MVCCQSCSVRAALGYIFHSSLAAWSASSGSHSALIQLYHVCGLTRAEPELQDLWGIFPMQLCIDTSALHMLEHGKGLLIEDFKQQIVPVQALTFCKHSKR